MQLLITAVGADRPGLVHELSGFLHECSANIADSRMINLSGQFAMILLVELAEEAAEDLGRNLSTMGDRIGMSLSAAPLTAATEGARGIPFRMRTYAMDQPGIVHRITHLLHERRINVEELATRLEPGSVSGTPLFSMELRMTVPPVVQMGELRRDLERLCDAMNCDLDLEPA